MASSIDFVQYIADQCSGAADITARKMFGDYGLYCDGKIVGLICDDRLYVKPTEAARLTKPCPSRRDGNDNEQINRNL